MKALLLLIFIPFISEGQSVEQTLSYINNQLNDKSNKPSYIMVHTFVTNQNLLYEQGRMTDYAYYVTIEKGLLNIKRYLSKSRSTGYNPSTNRTGEEKYTAIIEELSVPIKAINIDDNTGFEYLCKGFSPSTYYLYLKDKNIDYVTKISRELSYTGQELRKKTERLNSCGIQFSNDNLLCDKIRNAFTHLIVEASADPRYSTLDNIVETDPFANPTKSDSLVTNGIKSKNSNSVAMTKKGGVYEVPLVINGVLKLNFIIDAGASDVSLSPDVALTLTKTGTLTEADFIETVTYKFANGKTEKSDVYNIREIQLGNKKVFNVRASVSKSLKAPLLLGQSVLNKFGKVTIDYKKGEIVFQD